MSKKNIYEVLQMWLRSEGEFGADGYMDTIIHRDPQGSSTLIVSCRGHRIMEAFPNGDLDFIVPPNGITSAILRRWACYVPNSYGRFMYRKNRKASGVHTYEVTYLWRNSTNDKFIQKYGVTHRLSFNFETGEFHTGKDKTYVVNKDNKKYREFNAKLKKVRAMLHAKFLMGAFDAHYPRSSIDRKDPKSTQGAELLRKMGLIEKDTIYVNELAAIEGVKQLISAAVTDDDLSNSIGDIHACLWHLMPYYRNYEAIRASRTMANVLRRVQVKFLRSECVTITGPITPESSVHGTADQDNVLLPTTGLREVQVSGEVEVC